MSIHRELVMRDDVRAPGAQVVILWQHAKGAYGRDEEIRSITYHSDVMEYEATYYPDEGGWARAIQDGAYLLLRQVPPGLYPASCEDGTLSWDDITFLRR